MDAIDNIKKLFQDIRSQPLKTLDTWQNFRITWVVMLSTAFFLELCALIFQHSFHIDPCERCVYQRLAVVLLMVTSLIMLISPTNISLKVSAYVIWVCGAVYGLKEAIAETSDYVEFNPFESGCSLRPVFPFDIPLDQWLPSVFMPSGLCGTDDWIFLTLNMAQWMVIIFSVYLVAAWVCIISFIAGLFGKTSRV